MCFTAVCAQQVQFEFMQWVHNRCSAFDTLPRFDTWCCAFVESKGANAGGPAKNAFFPPIVDQKKGIFPQRGFEKNILLQGPAIFKDGTRQAMRCPGKPRQVMRKSLQLTTMRTLRRDPHALKIWRPLSKFLMIVLNSLARVNAILCQSGQPSICCCSLSGESNMFMQALPIFIHFLSPNKYVETVFSQIFLIAIS